MNTAILHPKPDFKRLDEFTRGYLVAAFFTNDDDMPSGCLYEETDRPETLYSRLHPDNLQSLMIDCVKFQKENAALLERAGDAFQNGCDLWYGQGDHGVGYWDRGYPDEVGDALSEAARKTGEKYFTAEGDTVYIE